MAVKLKCIKVIGIILVLVKLILYVLTSLRVILTLKKKMNLKRKLEGKLSENLFIKWIISLSFIKFLFSLCLALR